MSERDNLPRWRGQRGHYEVWYLTMSSPDGRTGYWIRYTLRAPIAGPVEPRVWFARFDREDPTSTFGINMGYPADAYRSEAEEFDVRIGDALLRSGRAAGSISGGGHHVRWDLEFDADEPTFRLLPGSVYRGRAAPTRPIVPNPDVRYTGTVEVDGEPALVDGFPGHQGHVEGGRHGERWAWAACNAFGDGDVIFQALSAQGRLGPVRTPHLTFAALWHDGRWIRLWGAAARKAWSLGRWRLRLEAPEHRLEGEVWAEPKHLLQARYVDPDDTPRWCHHSDVALCRLTLWEREAGGWREAAELVSDGTTQAEWAGRTPAPGVEAVHQELP